MKPKPGNSCEECEKRFKCFTKADGEEVCPIRFGDEIDTCFTYYDNLYVIFSGDAHSQYRIKAPEIMKALQKVKFRTYRKHGRTYLQVIEEPETGAGQ